MNSLGESISSFWFVGNRDTGLKIFSEYQQAFVKFSGKVDIEAQGLSLDDF